jgi:hypothetical protein
MQFEIYSNKGKWRNTCKPPFAFIQMFKALITALIMMLMLMANRAR